MYLGDFFVSLLYINKIMKDRTRHIKNPSKKGLEIVRNLRKHQEAIRKYHIGEITMEELKKSGVRLAAPI